MSKLVYIFFFHVVADKCAKEESRELQVARWIIFRQILIISLFEFNRNEANIGKKRERNREQRKRKKKQFECNF